MLLRYFLVGGFFIGTLLSRPMHLGSDYALPGAIICFLSGISVLGLKKKKYTDFLYNFYIATSILLFWFYTALHGMISGATLPYAFNVFILVFLVMAGAVGIMSDPVYAKTFLRLLVLLITLCGGSAIITYILLFLGVSQSSLYLLHIPNTHYPETGNLLFPFSLVYQEFTVIYPYPRLSHFFRESGIAAAFVVWAWLSLPSLGLDKIWIKILLLAAGLSTISSALVPIFLACLLWQELILWKDRFTLRAWGRVLVIFVFSAIAFYEWIFLDLLGLAVKMEGVSGTFRLNSIVSSLQLVADNPLGVGLYNKTGFESSVVTLISQISGFGIPGLALLMIAYLTSIFLDKSPSQKFLFLLPILIVWTFSQPLVGATLVYVIFLQSSDYSMERLSNRRATSTGDYNLEKALRRFARPKAS